MPRSPAADATNRAERVSTCESCGGPVVAGARGPLPRRHRDCRPVGQQLLYHLRSAARLAYRTGFHSIGHELDTLAAGLVGGRWSTSALPPPALLRCGAIVRLARSLSGAEPRVGE